jgi:hypothetical protein
MSESVSAIIDRLIAQDRRREQAAGAVLPGGAAAALQGLTFGFGEEAVAGLRSAVGRTPYEQALAEERANLAQYREQYPGRAAAFEVAGAIPTAIAAGLATPATGGASAAAGAANVARAAGMGARIAQGARTGVVTGAATGGLQGFGEGEGGLGERLSSAVGGAALGGVAGGVIGGAAPVAVERAQTFYRGLRGGAPEAERRLAGLPPGTAAADIEAALAARQAGVPGQAVTLAERLGEQGMTAAEALAQAPGTTRQTAADLLRARTAGAGDRVDAGLRAVFGDVEDAYERSLALRAQRQQDAIPAYQAAFSSARPLAEGELKDTIERIPTRYRSRAERRARDEAQAVGQTVDFKGTPTARDLHYLKMGLDQEIDTLFRAGDAGAANLLKPFRDRIVGTLDDVTRVDGRSLYQEARALYAEPSALLRAQKLGQDVFSPSMRPQDLRDRLAKMSPDELSEFSNGLMSKIREQIQKVKGERNIVNSFFGDQRQKELIRTALEAVAGDKDAGKLKFELLRRFLETETGMRGFQSQMLGGSATARRLLGQELVGAGGGAAGGAGLGYLGGYDPTSAAAMGAAAGAGLRSLRGYTGGRAQDIMGQRLLETDPMAQMKILTQMAQARQREMANQQRLMTTIPGGVSALAGQQIGGAPQAPMPGLLR